MKWTFEKVMATLAELTQERYEWEQEWRDISQYLIPGRGVYQLYSRPQKRKLVSNLIINPTGGDALSVLTSGIHGRLTSPAVPWFRLTWPDSRLNKIEELKAWLQQSQDILHAELHNSNFYSVISSFYTEYAGFGTASMFVGEAPKKDKHNLDFQILTAGEYYLAYSTGHEPSIYVRSIMMSERKLAAKYPETASKELLARVEKNEYGIDIVRQLVVELTVREKFQDKAYTQVAYEVGGLGGIGAIAAGLAAAPQTEPLSLTGFYEFPYPTARWDTVGADVYGLGPGSRALPQIKRLQEQEKAFLMAVHKSIDPPVNAPGRMRGKLATLPGGVNYYSNPAETVKELYQLRFDFSGVSTSIERVEEQIKRNFYNEVFITASRDPDASPLRTGQVQVQEQEKLLRLGPVVERLQSEFFIPVISRCFQILLRAGKLPALNPAFEKEVANMGVTLTSPLAMAQKKAKSAGVDSFMGFIGQAAQFDPTILDNINADAAARQRADIEDVEIGILRPEQEVQQIRAQRAEQQRKQQEAEQQAQQAQLTAQGAQASAGAGKAQAESGKILAETQQINREAGVL